MIKNNIPKTIGAGGFGKCKVYYSDKYKRMVIEKEVGPNFLRLRESGRTRFNTLMRAQNLNEDLLKKEMSFLLFAHLKKLDCCVEILDFKNNPFKIIMEYCEGGDLRKVLNTHRVPLQDKITMIAQILRAIKRIHEIELIHGDLKCDNIFLVRKYIPGDVKNIKIKIGDFGLSEFGGSLVHGGTPGFMAPEVPRVGGSFESDIYSIGKVMLEIMTELPVPLLASINSNNLHTIQNKMPQFFYVNEFNNIVRPCLSEEPKMRPKAGEVCEQFEQLLNQWTACEEINRTLLSKYKIGTKIPVDCHIHPVYLSDDRRRKYNGNKWYCNICNDEKKYYFPNILSFNCNLCKYDLCQKCIEQHNFRVINNMMMKRVPRGKKVYIIKHPHPLLLSGYKDRNYFSDGNWVCDICKDEYSGYIYSFHCSCGFDCCFNCFSKYFMIKEEESCCNIF